MLENKVFSKVFMWLFIGLLITFATGFLVAQNENMVFNLFSNNIYWIGLCVLSIGIAFWLNLRIHKMELMTATILYMLYSLLMGVTFSVIFIVFNMASIIMIFGITAIVFGIFALLGYFTKVDLTKFSTLLLVALVALIIATIVNLWLGNETLQIVLSWVGILIFVGFTAYDMQNIKRNLYQLEDPNKLAIIGAFQLYIDFINIFIDLLNIFGQEN